MKLTDTQELQGINVTQPQDTTFENDEITEFKPGEKKINFLNMQHDAQSVKVFKKWFLFMP